MTDTEPVVARSNALKLRRLGIDTHQELVVYMRAGCSVCRSEGFEAQSRVTVSVNGRSIIATLNIVTSEGVSHALLAEDEAGLSESAWRRLGRPVDQVGVFSHPEPVDSLSYVRSKVFGNALSRDQYRAIMRDIVDGQFADVHLAAFLTACVGERLSGDELVFMTEAMTDIGERMEWDRHPVMDKHCIGGLPGNRTTPIIVAIVAAYGLTIPKTSSRAITSPAGTADTMAMLAPVDLGIEEIRNVVRAQGACIVWGGAVKLSPADDVLIRVERVLELDSEGQLIASVLSKKLAAGSTHVVIDIPVGPTAKVRSHSAAERLSRDLISVAEAIGLRIRVVTTDGRQPVGRGIGPALEARDVLAVLRGDDDAPADLRERALRLAGEILEFSGEVDDGNGVGIATEILDDGRAWEKFCGIRRAQGGLREPPIAEYQRPVKATESGDVAAIDNRKLARAAKLAGAPADPEAGIELHVRLGDEVEAGQTIFTLHADSPGERDYALDYISEQEIIQIRK